jgi:nicotinate-nucleotide adenylyltransferase
MRIGILGGSFDPPHIGHIEMAKAAQEFLNLDTVLFVPAAKQWQKDHYAPADVRAHMTHLAISNHPEWAVSFVDIDRGGDTISFDTISHLKKIYPSDELFFILGSDSANSLNSWKQSEELKKLIVFAVVKRFGVEIQVPEGFDFLAVPGDIQGISSTDIRETVSKSKKVELALKDLVPTEVAKYIAAVGLYK